MNDSIAYRYLVGATRIHDYREFLAPIRRQSRFKYSPGNLRVDLLDANVNLSLPLMMNRSYHSLQNPCSELARRTQPTMN